MSEPTHHERFGCDVCFGFEPPRDPKWRDNITKTCDPCEARITDRVAALAEARAASEVPPDHNVTWIDAGRDEPLENGYWRCACGKHFAPDGVDEYAKHRAGASEVPPPPLDRGALEQACIAECGPWFDESHEAGQFTPMVLAQRILANYESRLTPPEPPVSQPRICPDCDEPIVDVSHWHDERPEPPVSQEADRE